jgi:hypothetical protein
MHAYSYPKLGGVGDRLGLRDLDLDRLLLFRLLDEEGDLERDLRRLSGVGDLLNCNYQ